MKPYLLFSGLLIFLGLMFWVVLPYLYSADDDLSVGLAIILTFFLVPVVFLVVMEIRNTPQVQLVVTKIKGAMK